MLIVDPPSGWKYGFPQPLELDYEAQLKRSSYPRQDVDFALRHSRYWSDETVADQLDRIQDNAYRLKKETI